MSGIPLTYGYYPLPAREGEAVTFTSGRGRVSGRGVFRLCWMGVEEVWDVETPDGSTVHLYPCFGDTMTPADR